MTPNGNRRFGNAVAMLALGAFSLATALAPQSAAAANRTGITDANPSFDAPDDSHEAATFSLIAADRGRTNREATETREPSSGKGGSLILMEIRTQRGSANSARTTRPDLDPRTKPLGW